LQAATVTEADAMTDRGSARLSMIRRWFQELNPFRVAIVGRPDSERTAVHAVANERYSPRRAWADVLSRRLRPEVVAVASPNQLADHWDLALQIDSASLPPQLAIDAANALRRKSRFVVVAAPTDGPNVWPTEARRRLRPLAVHAHGGEELLLLRGGATAAPSAGPRVWYLAPNRHVYGGVKILYNHVDMLASIGIDAVLAVEDGVNWPAQWFPWNPETLVFGENIRNAIGPDDVVVIPEFRYRDVEQFPHVRRRLLFVQNQGLAAGVGDWGRLGYDGVLTLGRPDGIPSYLEEHLMRRRCRLPIFTIPNHFDDDGWHEISNRSEPGSILCLPRKGPEFVARIVREFGSAVKCVENAHQLEMAAAYASADVYVHTGFPEGLGMPIVEAMLAGCISCGFSGGGGLDVMADGRTAYLAADGDMGELLTAIRRALSSPVRQDVRSAGRRAARRFNRAAAQSALEQCYRRWLPSLPVNEQRGRARRSPTLIGAMLGR
jgi:glycosyltransferase involved in cell wall biosynthesis